MGAFAQAVQERLRDRLAIAHPGFEWTTEFYVERTPIDVVGERGDRMAFVEVESRRADPANNPVTVFRHATEDAFGGRSVVLCQVFSAYYDLARGGVSSKRKDAEFVGRVAADAFDSLEYAALDMPVDPPKAGGEFPDGWETAVDEVAGGISDAL